MWGDPASNFSIQAPNFLVLEKTSCEALLAPAWEGCQGAEAALLSRGPSVPLAPSKNTFPHRRLTTNVDAFLPETQTCAYTRAYQPAHSVFIPPPPAHIPVSPTKLKPPFLQPRTPLHPQ